MLSNEELRTALQLLNIEPVNNRKLDAKALKKKLKVESMRISKSSLANPSYMIKLPPALGLITPSSSRAESEVPAQSPDKLMSQEPMTPSSSKSPDLNAKPDIVSNWMPLTSAAPSSSKDLRVAECASTVQLTSHSTYTRNQSAVNTIAPIEVDLWEFIEPNSDEEDEDFEEPTEEQRKDVAERLKKVGKLYRDKAAEGQPFYVTFEKLCSGELSIRAD
jgi:hypothetical protein